LWDIISPGRWRVQYSFVSGKLAEGFLMGMIRESVWTAVGVGTWLRNIAGQIVTAVRGCEAVANSGHGHGC
jgi:hypothetical protein